MIDIEDDLFAPLARELRESFGKINITGEYVNAPSSFPHVSVEEADNFTPKYLEDSSESEKYAEVMYEINVYSNKKTGKKRQCRDIIALIDSFMVRHNFRRYSLMPVPNMENATIYRLTARYRAITDGKTIYRK